FMTAAPPGQGGHFRVNEQPYDYWIERFRKFDYAPDAELRELVAGFVDEGRRLQDAPLPGLPKPIADSHAKDAPRQFPSKIRTSPNRNVVDVNYTLTVVDRAGKHMEEIKEVQSVRYLFLPEIELLAAANGFEIAESREWLTGNRLQPRSWSGYAVARPIPS